MTDELNLTEVSWGDHRIRMIEIDGGKYIPVGDLAKATGVRKRSLQKILDNNKEVFSQHERVAHMGTPGGSQETRCIDSDGAYLLLTRISTNHIKSEATKKNLVGFNNWIVQRAKGQITLPESLAHPPVEKELKKPDFDHIWAELQFVKRLAKETGWDLNELRIAALRDHNLYGLAMVGEKSKPAEPPLALPAPAPEKKFKGFYTATDIGELCGKKGQEINQWLYNNNYIVKGEGDEWRLTEQGKDYAYEHPYCPPNTLILRNRIEWKKDILEKMNIHKPEAPA